MWRSGFFFLFSQSLACVSSPASDSLDIPIPLSMAAKTKPTENSTTLPACNSAPIICPAEEKNLPYQCIAYRYQGLFLWEAQRIYAWSSSLCQTRKIMHATICKNAMESQHVSDIDCTPDPTLGACQTLPPPTCSTAGKASFCSVTQYHEQEIPWSEQPTAWGDSECLAQHALKTISCQHGLDPKDLGPIACTTNPAPQSCPPIPPTCLDGEPKPTQCQVSRIGDITLKKAWTATGYSACEAEYKLQVLACRFTNAAKELTPLPLGSMECQSLPAPL